MTAAALDPVIVIPEPGPSCPKPCADEFIDRGLCNCWARWVPA